MKMIAFTPTVRMPAPGDGVLRSQWRVGRRTVTMTQIVEAVPGSVGYQRVEWEPDLPRHGLSKRECREYREGRDAHYQRMANILGSKVAVVEI